VKSHNELIIRNGQTILKLSDSLFTIVGVDNMPAFLRPASLQSALSYACCCDSNNIFSLLNLRHLSPCSSLVPQIFQLDAQVCSLIDERLIWLELKSIVSIFLVTFGVSALLCIVYILNNHHLILIVYLMG